MITYRVSISKKPTIRLYKKEKANKKYLGEVAGWKAELVRSILFNGLSFKEIIRFRDGRIIMETDEDTAIKIMIGLKSIIGLRRKDKVAKILEAIKAMDKGEIYSWYSLSLKIGKRAIQALRLAYLPK